MRNGLFALLLASPLAAHAAEPAPTDAAAAEKLAGVAMKRLKAEGMAGFVDAAFDPKTGLLPASRRVQTQDAFGKTREATVGLYGKPVAEAQLLRTDVAGRALVRCVFLERMERAPLIWQLGFRCGEGGPRWLILNVTPFVDSEFRSAKADDPEFQGAAKLAQAGIDGLKAGGVPGLFDVSFAEGGNVLSVERGPLQERFVKLRQNVLAQIGKSAGEFELVRTEAVGTAVVRFVYVEKGELGAAVWKFTFYRPDRDWKWSNVNINTDLIGDFPVSP